MDEPVIDSYFVDNEQLHDTFTSILKNYQFKCEFGNFDQDIERLQEQLFKQVPRLSSEVFEMQFISTPFIRGNVLILLEKLLHNFMLIFQF